LNEYWIPSDSGENIVRVNENLQTTSSPLPLGVNGWDLSPVPWDVDLYLATTNSATLLLINISTTPPSIAYRYNLPYDNARNAIFSCSDECDTLCSTDHLTRMPVCTGEEVTTTTGTFNNGEGRAQVIGQQLLALMILLLIIGR